MTMNEDQHQINAHLRDALRAVADADAELGTSIDVEARLMAAVRARRAHERRRQLMWLAAAAAIVVAVTAARWRASIGPEQPAAPVATDASRTSDAVPADFLPLPYAHVPVEHGQIVQMVVPASTLASFGLEPASAGTDAVTADVFVGEDGLARAVRFSPFRPEEPVQ